MKIKLLTLAILSANLQYSHAELTGMDETDLETISGQTGITLEMDQAYSIGSILYSDDDNLLELTDIKIGNPNDITQTAKTTHVIDVDGTDGIVIDSTYEPTSLQIGAISVGDYRGVNSFGSFRYDYEGHNLLKIRGKSDGSNGFIFNNETDITKSDLQWTTNGHSLLIDDLAYHSKLTDMTLDVEDVAGRTALVFAIPSFEYSFTMAGLCFTSLMDCAANQSFGSLSGAMAYRNSYVHIFGGGRSGAGISLNSYFEIDDTKTNYLTYTDDGQSLSAGDMTGYTQLTNLTFDVMQGNPVDHIEISFDRLEGTFRAGDLRIGAGSIGQFQVDYLFEDGQHIDPESGSLRTYHNTLKLAPGISEFAIDWSGDAVLAANGFDSLFNVFYGGDVNQGISSYFEWNMRADALYSDDYNAADLVKNTIIVSNFQSYGSGFATLDVRNDGSEDYLAIGMRNIRGSYSIDGLRVGSKNAELQGGTELLLPLGIYPAYDFNLNGLVEMRTGGRTGNGLTFDGDILITDGTFALSTNILNEGTANERIVGIWADDVTNAYHFRDYTLDVESDGIKLVQGQVWSDLDIGNLRWGDKYTGSSLGRIRMTRYETDSSLVIKAGGAGGTACIGGNGANESACDASGGYWTDRGSEGVTIGLKKNLMKADLVDTSKRNSFMWENNRAVDVNGKPINGTGTQLLIDNYYTTDGYDSSNNDYGLQVDIAVDVAPTKVIKKFTGLDANGIAGNKGDEKIMTSDNTYVYVSNPSAAQKANRPKGFAVAADLRFKEMTIDSVQLIHTNDPTPAPVISGMTLQNFNFTSNLTATPIQ